MSNNMKHEVKVNFTTKIAEFLKECLSEKCINSNLDDDMISEITAFLDEASNELKFSILKEVYNVYRKTNEKELTREYFVKIHTPIYLHQLLEGSELRFSSPILPQKNPKLVARLEKLQCEQDNRDYAKMVSNIGSNKVEKGSLALDLKSLNTQAIHGFNILLSFVCGFAFGFASGYLMGLDNHWSALIGIVICIPVLLADMYFLLKYYEDGNVNQQQYKRH